MTIMHFEEQTVTLTISRKCLVTLAIVAGFALWIVAGIVVSSGPQDFDFSDLLR